MNRLDQVDAAGAEPVPDAGAAPDAGWLAAAAPLAGLALAACGADSGGSSSTPTVTTTTTAAPVYVLGEVPAARFLAQSTMGTSRADITRLRTIGYERWLDEEFAKPRGGYWDWLVSAGFATADSQNNLRGFDPAIWRQLIAGQDQLRQRVTMALLEILVVGIDGLTSGYRQFTMAAYLDVLANGAFGNYRDLLEQVSLSAAMGFYLTFAGNRRANAATGAIPDENYGREVMQLFTIGTSMLEMDGTQRLSGGRPIETYGPADVAGLARVFTGFNITGTDTSTPDRLRAPMTADARFHESGEKAFLGVTIPANTDAAGSLRIALDTLFAHPNLPPFIARQMIQRLVTSNPSPAYVGRVASVFAGAGGSPRGDMKALIRAILLDDEARNPAIATGASFGRLREPMMRLTGWARAFGVTSPSDAWAFGDTSSSANRLGQSPGHSPSVFNFFRPGYSPPGTAIGAQGLVAPEFQITNEASVIAYLNYMQSLITNGAGDAVPNYADMLTKVEDSAALVGEANLLLAGGQLGATAIGTIRAAVDSIPMTATNAALQRVRTAVLLTMAAPEYLVQR